MPYITVREVDYRGFQYYGAYRTLAAAQAAVTASSEENVSALTDKILDSDIPNDARPREGWWVRPTQEVTEVNAYVEIQYGTSGKGFRIEFHTGAEGAEGNGWTVLTTGTHISIDADAMQLGLPEPGGSAADYLLALNSVTGTYTFAATYLTGTTGLDDLAGVGSTTWQRADGHSGTPTFAGGITGEPSRYVVYDTPLPLYTPRAQAAYALDQGLSAFHDFVLQHAAGIDIAVIDKVHEFLYQKRRANRMAYNDDVTIGGNAVTLTDAQYIAWATFSRFGPLDTSAVTSLGEYNPEGLFEIFERADDPTILDPTGPITWVGLDVTQWAGGYPNRLNVAQIAPVLGTAPSQYLNIDDDSWLRSE